MDSETLKQFISGISDLPVLPTIYTALREKIYDPDSSANDIAEIIVADQAVSAKILKIANSAFYGFTRKIDTIPHAIVVIGFNGINTIILNMAILGLFKDKEEVENFDIKGIWQHSLACAAAARLIAKKVDYKALEEIFTGGLLHDIGRVLIYQYLTDDFSRIVEKVRKENTRALEAEAEVLGLNHCEIGKGLLEHWNFPDNLIAMVFNHHAPLLAKSYVKEASIIHLADIICRGLEIGKSIDSFLPILDQEIFKTLNLTELDAIDIVANIDQELKKFDIFEHLRQEAQVKKT